MSQATTDLVMIHEEKQHLLRTKVGHRELKPRKGNHGKWTHE